MIVRYTFFSYFYGLYVTLPFYSYYSFSFLCICTGFIIEMGKFVSQLSKPLLALIEFYRCGSSFLDLLFFNQNFQNTI